MGFHPQPNDWTCGPFALKHALVALGLMIDEQEISRHARTHWWSGTDELRLAQAAKVYECELTLERRRDPDRARKALIGQLKRTPAILCVDGWEHWITVLRHHQGKFVVVDSNLDPVLNVLTWSQLRRRWEYRDTDYDPEDPPSLYESYAVEPQFRVTLRADFSLARVRFLRHSANRSLAVHWDEYLTDLLEICRPRSNRMHRPLSMAELLRRHQELIVSRSMYWHGDVERPAVEGLLRNLRFVAETYGLVIPEAGERRAVADLAILTSMWIAALRGAAPMYGVGK